MIALSHSGCLFLEPPAARSRRGPVAAVISMTDSRNDEAKRHRVPQEYPLHRAHGLCRAGPENESR
jgi:hypothetical protein